MLVRYRPAFAEAKPFLHAVQCSRRFGFAQAGPLLERGLARGEKRTASRRRGVFAFDPPP